jgi:outer membrane protein TolC
MTLACVLVCAVVTSRVQGQSAGAAADPDSALAEALGEIGGAPLTLDRSIELALANATEVRAAEAQLLAARGSVKRERGAFDPTLFAETEKRVEDQPTASFFAGADVLETDERTTSGGARVRLPFGTELEASLETTRLETNSAFAFLSPQYDTAGRLEIRQPVLKGFGPSTRSDLTAAERELEAAEADYQDVVIAVRTEVEQTYWDLYAAERDLAVQRLIRDRALAFLDQAELRAQAGLVGPSEPANARVFLAQQEQEVLDREEEVDGFSDRLASLMGQRPPDGLARYRPTDEPPRDFPIEPQDAVVARAIERNRALVASERIVESVRARARGARWNAYPTLDVFGSLGGNGLSGRPRDVVFGGDTLRTTIDGGFGQTWAQVRDRDFPTWSAGLRLEIPIGFREGRGERDRLEAEVIRAEQAHLARVRALEELVRGSHRELENASRRLEVAEDGVEASLEQVRIGVLEYDAGRSTAFELVRLGADLAEAQQRYSQALVRTAKAAAELRRLTSDGYPAAADDAGQGGGPHSSDGEG